MPALCLLQANEGKVRFSPIAAVSPLQSPEQIYQTNQYLYRILRYAIGILNAPKTGKFKALQAAIPAVESGIFRPGRLPSPAISQRHKSC